VKTELFIVSYFFILYFRLFFTVREGMKGGKKGGFTRESQLGESESEKSESN